jgi:hypothetical protein
VSTIKIYSPDNLTEELATVKVASSCSRSEKINGENILSFAIPVKNPASTHINEVNVIGIDGDFFDIAAYAKQQNGAGLRMVDVECEHVSYRLNDPEFNLEFFTKIGTPTAVLTELLVGTGFSIGTVDFTDEVTYSAQQAMSRRGLVVEFARILGGELAFSGFEVSILTQRGSATAKPLIIGRDVSVLGKQVDKRQRDAEGNPIIAYTCGVYNVDALALGDVVTISESGMAIDATLRIVGLSYDPFNPRNSTVIEVGNATRALEDDLYRIETQTVVKDKLYNGTRIGPVYGFENILSDKKFRSYFNALGMAFQVGDGTGENWVDKLYLDIDSETGEAQLMFDGTLSANVINALKASIDVVISNTTITNVMTAQKGYIADLTVASLDTCEMIARYLLTPADDDYALRKAPVAYQRMYKEVHEKWVAEYAGDIEGEDNATQVTDYNGNLMYWLDAEHIGNGWTYDETDYPIMRLVYDGPDGMGRIKKREYFAEVDGVYIPATQHGLGTGVGDNGKCFVMKDRSGYKIKYFSAIDGAERSIYLNDDGIELIPGFDGQGATLYTGLDTNKPNIVGLNIEETLASVSAFVAAAGLGYSFAEQALVACTTGSGTIQYVTRGGEFVRSIALAGASTLNGLEIDGDDDDYVWTTSGTRIFKHNNKTGADISPATTSYAANGIAAPPGDYIYFGEGATNLQKALKSTGAAVASYDVGISVSGVAYDGAGHLWVVGISSTVVLFDIATGTIIYTDTLPATSYTGATFDGNSLWAVDYNADAAVRIKTSSRNNSFYYATDTEKLYISSDGVWNEVSGGNDRSLTVMEKSTTGSISAEDNGKVIIGKASAVVTWTLPVEVDGLNYYLKNAGSANLSIVGNSVTENGGGGVGIDSYAVSALHFDGANDGTTFTDETGRTWTSTGAVTKTAQKKFGTASGYFGGSSRIETEDSDDFNFGSGDFTIDFWVYTSVASAGYAPYYSQHETNSNRFFFSTGPYGDALYFFVASNDTTIAQYDIGIGVPNNQWNHIALVREASTIYIFVNGVDAKRAIVAIGSASIPNISAPVTVGARNAGGGTIDRYFTGYIDEMRISKGIARWTANFTPPTEPYGITEETTTTSPIDGDEDGITLAPLEAKRVVCDGTEWWTI